MADEEKEAKKKRLQKKGLPPISPREKETDAAPVKRKPKKKPLETTTPEPNENEVYSLVLEYKFGKTMENGFPLPAPTNPSKF